MQQYDSNGKMLEVTDNRGSTEISYNSTTGQVMSVSDPITGSISYTYNAYGDLATKTLPGGGTYTYNYTSAPCVPKDDLNSVGAQMTSIADDANNTVNYSMDFFGHMIQVEAEANNYTLKTYYTYDHINDANTRFLLTQIKTVIADGNGAYTLNQNDYTYDSLGNRLTNTVSGDPDKTGTVQTDRVEEYDYDALGQLTAVDYDDGEQQSYTFDNMGNRLSKTDGGTTNYTYNNANMMLSAGSNTYTYDAAGNTLTGGGRTNTWDSQNRLTQCVYDGKTTTYTYGSDGLRRSSTLVNTNTTTHYALDGQNVVREMTPATGGGMTNKATYFIGARGPEYRRDDVADTYKWYVYDGLGSVVGEVDDSGNMSAPRAYDVYGLVRSGASGSSSQKFCGSLGHMSEDDTGLIYMRARYMDPSAGRFISEDPARSGKNWYNYCANNPINAVDASGKFLGLLEGVLLDLIEEGGDCESANIAREWGQDKIMSAASRYSGQICAWLAVTELDQLTGGWTGTGFGVFNDKTGRGAFFDLVNIGHEEIHIDFQCGKNNYYRQFIQGFMDGLSGF